MESAIRMVRSAGTSCWDETLQATHAHKHHHSPWIAAASYQAMNELCTRLRVVEDAYLTTGWPCPWRKQRCCSLVVVVVVVYKDQRESRSQHELQSSHTEPRGNAKVWASSEVSMQGAVFLIHLISYIEIPLHPLHPGLSLSRALLYVIHFSASNGFWEEGRSN